MKLPHKLANLTSSTVKITAKINQIIDYLSDKEASKGELGTGSVNVAICDKCDSFYKAVHEKCHPPQQEESRGECDHNWIESEDGTELWCLKCKFLSRYHPKKEPQLKEDSPKEDEAPQADWVKELETHLDEMYGDWWETDGTGEVWLETNNVINFVKKQITLAQQRTEKKWREEIENSKVISSIGYRPSKFKGLSAVAIYNLALSDLLK